MSAATSESSPSKKRRAVEAMMEEAAEQQEELLAPGDGDLRVGTLLVDAEQFERDRALLEGAKTIILRGLEKDGKEFWDDLPVEWQNHRDVALAALKHEDISAEDLPISLQEDRSFLISAVNKDSDFWFGLPQILKDDIDFARSISSFTDDALPEILFQRFAVLRNERNIWLNIFKDPNVPELDYYMLVDNFAPQAIRADREIMLKACSFQDPILKDFVDTDLSGDHEFLVALLTENPAALRSIPDTAQQTFPDLIVRFLPNAVRRVKRSPAWYGLKSLACGISLDLWRNNRSIARAYFQAGGAFLDLRCMDHLKGDKEVFLWIAKYYPRDDLSIVQSFQYALLSIAIDKAFMMKAVELNPNIYHAAPEETLQKDFDMLLVAFGGTPGRYPLIDRAHWTQMRETIADFIPRVQKDLQNYKTFVGTLLFGMTQKQNSLALLNQGDSTALNYKRLIAAYLDVPTGKKLRMLRNASESLNSAFATVARFQ